MYETHDCIYAAVFQKMCEFLDRSKKNFMVNESLTIQQILEVCSQFLLDCCYMEGRFQVTGVSHLYALTKRHRGFNVNTNDNLC